MKLTGTVSLRDLEGGVWVLEGDDGRTYELVGGDGKLRTKGSRIEVEGSGAQSEEIPASALNRPFPSLFSAGIAL